MTKEQLERLTAQADTPAQVMRYIHDQTEETGAVTLWVEYIEPMPSEAGADLLIRTWTFKKTKRHGLQHMEVIRRIVGEETYSARGLDWKPVAGWMTCYDYPDEPWRTFEDKMLRQERPLLNPEILQTLPDWKYCGKILGNAWQYLTEYKADKAVEYFGKMGIFPYKTLLRKAKQDGQFRRWLYDHHTEMRWAGAQAIAYAYDHKVGIRYATERLERINRLRHELANDWHRAETPKGTWNAARMERLVDYIGATDYNRTDWNKFRSYCDYLRACIELELPMEDNILFPSHFDEAHDLRIRQLAARKEKLKAAERRQFQKQCDKFRTYETQNAELMIVLPHAVVDLVKEGTALDHCVGRMGYDKKVAEGTSLICFVRSIAEPDKPLYTFEYSLKEKRLKQEHGLHNAPPPAEASAFIKAWCENLTRTLKKERV